MPRAIIAPNERYHIFNRGFEKRNIFLTDRDFVRMLAYILFLQSPIPLNSVDYVCRDFLKTGKFNISKRKIREIIEKRTVELELFMLMKNHFHLIVYELIDGGISNYASRIANSFTKYFNIKNERSGYLFQGPFQSVHIETNEQLLHLSAYIHRNIREDKRWQGKEYLYPWSSFQDYINKNRWGGLLKQDIILEQFDNPDEYKKFVDTSGTKELDDDFILD